MLTLKFGILFLLAFKGIKKSKKTRRSVLGIKREKKKIKLKIYFLFRSKNHPTGKSIFLRIARPVVRSPSPACISGFYDPSVDRMLQWTQKKKKKKWGRKLDLLFKSKQMERKKEKYREMSLKFLENHFCARKVLGAFCEG